MKEKYPTSEQEPEEVNPNVDRKRIDRALQKGTTEDLMELFDSGVDIDQEDFEGRTALMLCVAKGDKETVEVLLQRGANVNYVYMYQGRLPMTALDAARQTSHGEIAEILEAYGAKTGKEVAGS